MEETKFRPRFKSEFSMGGYDFERYHKMLKVLDNVATRARMFDPNAIIPYHSILKELYINWRPVIYETKKKVFDKMFEDIEKKIVSWTNESRRVYGTDSFSFPSRIAKDLERIHIELLEVRQLIGLGIEVRKEITQRKKWERALKIGD